MEHQTGMKVLLINPPVRKKMQAQEIPIGLAMIAAIAKQEGHQLAFLDLNAHRVSLQIAAQEIAIDDYDDIRQSSIFQLSCEL